MNRMSYEMMMSSFVSSLPPQQAYFLHLAYSPERAAFLNTPILVTIQVGTIFSMTLHRAMTMVESSGQ